MGPKRPKTRQAGKAAVSDFLRLVVPIDRLTGSKLPSQGQVVGRMLYRRQNESETVRESARYVFDEIKDFWLKAGIPMQQDLRCFVKIEKLYKQWERLKSHCKERAESAKQQSDEEDFRRALNNLFDIAHADAMRLMTIEEDKKFLEQQRLPGRPGTIGALDAKLAKKQAQSAARKRAEEMRRERHGKEMAELSAAVRSVSPDPVSDEALAQSGDEFEDPDPDVLSEAASTSCPTPGVSSSRRGQKRIMTASLCAALDRVQLSDRNAMHVLVAVLSGLGLDANEYALNRQFIRRSRMKHREEVALRLKADIALSGVLTVHWDGKLIPDLTGVESVDRLPILISGGGDTELLGVRKLPSGTGEAQAVFKLLGDYSLNERVAAMSFDTTNANSGPQKGACILLEQLLSRELLWLACRHHIAELLLKAAYESLFGKSSAPTVPLFDRFKAAWSSFESHVEDNMIDENILNALSMAEKSRIAAFIHDILASDLPRDDYQELLQLTLILPGEKPIESFRAAGAVSHARWMAKAIYCIKIWLFREKFSLSRGEKRSLPAMCLFIVRAYVEYWYRAPLPLSAARVDLEMVKTLWALASEEKAKKGNAYLAAAKKLCTHLWYLSDEPIALAFFDSEISTEQKRLMVSAYQNRIGNAERTTRLQVPSPHLIKDSKLEDFVTQNSKSSFEITGVSDKFMSFDPDPDQWETDGDFKRGRAELEQLKVTNDVAERGVALIEQFNKKLTKDEDQLQFLLTTVALHRKRYPDTKKNTLLSHAEPSESQD